jgi:hypothetical protein
MMRRAGIDVLPLAEGLPVVWQEVTAGTRGEVVIGKGLGVLTAARDPQGGIDVERLAARVAAERLPMVGKVVSMHVHEGLRIETTLDPKSEPFLRDHAIDGVPVLPGVMGLEGFAEVARLLLPDHRVVGLEHVRFEAPLKFHRHEPRPGTFRALLKREGSAVLVEVTLSSTQVLPNGDTREKLHFRGTVRLERAGAPVEAKHNGLHTSGARVGSVAASDVYRVFFHGPSYQVIGDVEATERGARGRMRASLPPALAEPGWATLFSPRVVELCLQTAGVYELGTSGRMALPAAIERVVTHGVPPEAAELTAEVQPRPAEGGVAFDARVCDAEGRVYVELEGYRTSALPTPPSEALLAPMRNAFARERA